MFSFVLDFKTVLVILRLFVLTSETSIAVDYDEYGSFAGDDDVVDGDICRIHKSSNRFVNCFFLNFFFYFCMEQKRCFKETVTRMNRETSKQTFFIAVSAFIYV